MAKTTDDEDLKAAQFITSEMNRTMTPSVEKACDVPTYGGPCVLEKGHYGFVGHWSAESLEREKHWPCIRDDVACSDPKCLKRNGE